MTFATLGPHPPTNHFGTVNDSVPGIIFTDKPITRISVYGAIFTVLQKSSKSIIRRNIFSIFQHMLTTQKANELYIKTLIYSTDNGIILKIMV